MIKIASIYRSANGTQEPFELEFSAENFLIPEVEGPIQVCGSFMRVEEGVMMLVQSIEAIQISPCSRCGKMLKFSLPFQPSEWLFYDDEPHEDDAEDEQLHIDLHRLELDPYEPIRQDLILNLEQRPHCKKPCKKYEESKEGDEGVKALAGLKHLMK